jgi:hypothetical protein
MWAIIVCLVLVVILIGILIWHIWHNVSEVDKLNMSLRQQQKVDTEQNQRLLADAAQLGQLSSSLSELIKNIKDITDTRLPKIDKAADELRKKTETNQSEIATLAKDVQPRIAAIGVALRAIVDGLQGLGEVLDEVFKGYSSMIDPEKKRLDANMLCLDNECISAAQLKNLMMAQQISTSTAPVTSTIPTLTASSGA